MDRLIIGSPAAASSAPAPDQGIGKIPDLREDIDAPVASGVSAVAAQRGSV
jgi:hypothetical protein